MKKAITLFLTGLMAFGFTTAYSQTKKGSTQVKAKKTVVKKHVSTVGASTGDAKVRPLGQSGKKGG